PFSGEEYSKWYKKQEAHQTEPVPKLEGELSEAIQPIINRMMAKRCRDRYEYPAQIAEALTPLSEISQRSTYAQTPAPKLADPNLSRTPVPTAYVSNTDVLGQEENREKWEDGFVLGDSLVNSKEKTLRPNESYTDVDSDHRKPTPVLKPSSRKWHRSRVVWVSIALFAVLLSSACWVLFRPASKPEFAEQMGALPGLHGGLNRDWWFAEMPWYGPGIRQALMQAVRNGETEIAGVSLEELETQLSQADTQTLQVDLRKIAQELKTRLTGEDRNLSVKILLHNSNTPNYEENLWKLIPEEFRGNEELDPARVANASATELHLLANLLHYFSSDDSTLAPKAEQLYQAAFDAYKESDDVERVLRALAKSDYSRFLAGRQDH
ncbi:MAG: hypothetical protein KDA84_12360, partial [Planctomycetaceae bacterium]|nr:hypothetical protein [Planctomycetaceae bacterium]